MSTSVLPLLAALCFVTAALPTAASAQQTGSDAQQQSADLQVTSSPSGAQVWLDDRPVATTPCYWSRLGVGEHQLRMSHPNYPTWRGLVFLRKGHANVCAADFAEWAEQSKLVDSALMVDAQIRSVRSDLTVCYCIFPVAVLAALGPINGWGIQEHRGTQEVSSVSYVIDISTCMLGVIMAIVAPVQGIQDLGQLSLLRAARSQLTKQTSRMSIGCAPAQPGPGLAWRF